MKKRLLAAALLASLSLSGCIVAPVGPHYREPAMRMQPPPPSYNWGYHHPHRERGWGRGWH